MQRTPLINEFQKRVEKKREKLGSTTPFFFSSCRRSFFSRPRELAAGNKRNIRFNASSFFLCYKLIVNNVPEHIAASRILDLIT